jgi:hypothetical protein
MRIRKTLLVLYRIALHELRQADHGITWPRSPPPATTAGKDSSYLACLFTRLFFAPPPFLSFCTLSFPRFVEHIAFLFSCTFLICLFQLPCLSLYVLLCVFFALSCLSFYAPCLLFYNHLSSHFVLSFARFVENIAFLFSCTSPYMSFQLSCLSFYILLCVFFALPCLSFMLPCLPFHNPLPFVLPPLPVRIRIDLMRVRIQHFF